MKAKKQNEKRTKHTGRKSQRSSMPFNTKEEIANPKRFRQRHAFEETKKDQEGDAGLTQIWDEDLCE